MMIQNSVSVLIRMTSQRVRALSRGLSLFVLAFFVLAPLTAQGLGEGDPAPEFLLSGSDGKRVSLQRRPYKGLSLKKAYQKILKNCLEKGFDKC